MEIVNKNINDLIHFPENPREATEKQYNTVKKSLVKYGWVNPITVNKRNNQVIGGNLRIKIARELGMTEVPVFYVDLDDEAAKELNFRLNANHGQFNLDLLANYDFDLLKDWGLPKELERAFGEKDESESLGYSIECPHCFKGIKVSNRIKTVDKL